MCMGEGNSSYFPSSVMYVLVECALPHSLAQDLSFHTVRWEQGIGWNYSTWWDETTRTTGRCVGLRPYRSPSTRLLRTREERQNEKELKAYILPQNKLIDRVKEYKNEQLRACYTAVNLNRPVSLSWKHWVSHHELGGQSFTACVSVNRKQEVRCHHSQTAWSHCVSLHTVNVVNCSIQTLPHL